MGALSKRDHHFLTLEAHSAGHYFQENVYPKKLVFLKGEQCGFLKLYLFMDFCHCVRQRGSHPLLWYIINIWFKHHTTTYRGTCFVLIYFYSYISILSEITRPFLAFHFTIWALKKTKKDPSPTLSFVFLRLHWKKCTSFDHELS